MVMDQREDIIHFLHQTIIELLEEKQALPEIDLNVRLTDLGIDSVQLMYLIVQMEKHLEIEFEDEELLFEQINTMYKITEICLSKLGVKG